MRSSFVVPLCVLRRSKNKLALEMNGSDQSAIADITVFDVVKRFRLVVMEVS